MKKILLLFIILSFIFPYSRAKALDTSSTNFVNNRYYNNLISDNDFTSINAMSVSDIQGFLTNNNSFLKTYSEGGRSAAQIIYDAAHAATAGSSDVNGTNGIIIDTSTGTVNPMVILVTLQKEQGLVSATSYNQSKLDCAMGYEGGHGCTWMYTNKPQWKGFANQVDWGAWQLRYNYYRSETARTWSTDYKVGQTTNLANTNYPNINVTFANRATAALYRYTPHVFNGNYNFWKFFNDYFGSWNIPTPPGVIDNNAVTMSTYSASLIVGTTCSMNITAPIGTTVYNVPCPDGSTKRVTIIRHKMADINGDGKIDLLDLSTFATNWNKNKPATQLANMNPDVDEDVNLLDLSILAANWGK